MDLLNAPYVVRTGKCYHRCSAFYTRSSSYNTLLIRSGAKKEIYCLVFMGVVVCRFQGHT